MLMRLLGMLCCMPATRVWAATNEANSNAADHLILGDAMLLYRADHPITCVGALVDPSALDAKDPFLGKTIFYIESDIDEHGKRIDFGLYVIENGVKSKLLGNARDIVVVNLTVAYFATKDGIYSYNKTANLAQKFGLVSDEVISVAASLANTGVLYYLNKQHQLYKLTEDGHKATIVDAVKNAEEFVMDYTGRLYYYTADKIFYVYDGDRVRKVKGLNGKLNNVWFYKIQAIVKDGCVVSLDNQPYAIEPVSATVEEMADREQKKGVILNAVSTDSNGFVLYFAINKKIYELQSKKMK